MLDTVAPGAVGSAITLNPAVGGNVRPASASGGTSNVITLSFAEPVTLGTGTIVISPAGSSTPATPDTIGRIDFGGNVSSIVSAGIPAATGAIGSSGKALKVEQTIGNEGWSGVTVCHFGKWCGVYQHCQ